MKFVNFLSTSRILKQQRAAIVGSINQFMKGFFSIFIIPRVSEKKVNGVVQEEVGKRFWWFHKSFWTSKTSSLFDNDNFVFRESICCLRLLPENAHVFLSTKITFKTHHLVYLCWCFLKNSMFKLSRKYTQEKKMFLMTQEVEVKPHCLLLASTLSIFFET